MNVVGICEKDLIGYLRHIHQNIDTNVTNVVKLIIYCFKGSARMETLKKVLRILTAILLLACIIGSLVYAFIDSFVCGVIVLIFAIVICTTVIIEILY